MGKKVIIVLIFLVSFFFVFKSFSWYYKTNHDVEYKIKNESKEYTIHEKYEYGSYIITVQNDEEFFVFDKENIYNKSEKIVKNIKVFEKDDISCISLLYVNDDFSTPLCIKDGKLFAASNFISYDYMKEYFNDVNYNYFSLNEEFNESFNDLKINSKDIDVNEHILVYNYKNIMSIGNKKISTFDFSSHDIYRNNIGYLVQKYYVIPYVTESQDYSYFLIYDIKKDKEKRLETNYKISKNINILGEYDGILYIFDRSNLKEYGINPEKMEINVVGSKESKGIYLLNGELKEVTVYDLLNENKFTIDISLYENIDYDVIMVQDRSAIYEKNGEFYKVYNDYLDKSIFLFKEDSAKEIKLNDENIYYISNDKLYKYNELGTIALINRNEFIYNSDNIYDVFIEN